MLTERQALDHDRIAQILGSEHRVLTHDESSNLVQVLHAGGKAAMLTEEAIQRLTKDRNDWWYWGFCCGVFSTILAFFAIEFILRLLLAYNGSHAG